MVFSVNKLRAARLALGLACLLQPTLVIAGSKLSAFAAASPPDGAQGVCQAFVGACHRNAFKSQATRSNDAGWLLRASEVNSTVNRAVLARSDQALYGRQNVWALPRNNQGDCKHLALMKKQLLIRSGLPASNLLLAVVTGSTEELHAVLVMRTNAIDYVLDNLDTRILPWTATGYTFLKMQNPTDGSRWDVILEGPRARRS
jgi:predicted transglutaminase-like cysteine proteinase